MIRLTESEIKGAVKIAEWQGLNFEATKTDCERIAKAQLKKVVKSFEEARVYVISGEGQYLWNLQKFREFWQALIKEGE